jgi:hypothetical protein
LYNIPKELLVASITEVYKACEQVREIRQRQTNDYTDVDEESVNIDGVKFTKRKNWFCPPPGLLPKKKYTKEQAEEAIEAWKKQKNL